MPILYRFASFFWAFLIWFGSGLAGGPGISTPKPWFEIVGFLLLALINLEITKKRYVYMLILFILTHLIYEAYLKSQLPTWTWDDVQKRYQIPIGILLFSVYSIWKSRPENNNALDDAEEDKKSN